VNSLPGLSVALEVRGAQCGMAVEEGLKQR
jgi:hypothetical protein